MILGDTALRRTHEMFRSQHRKLEEAFGAYQIELTATGCDERIKEKIFEAVFSQVMKGASFSATMREMSIRIVDNDKLEVVRKILQNYFTPENRPFAQ